MERNTNITFEDVFHPGVYAYPTAPIEEHTVCRGNNIDGGPISYSTCTIAKGMDVVWAEAKIIPPASRMQENTEQSKSRPSCANPSQAEQSRVVPPTKQPSSPSSATTFGNHQNENSEPSNILLLPISNCLDFLFGLPFAFAAFIVTFPFELVSTIVYSVASGFYYLSGGSRSFSERGAWGRIRFVSLRPIVELLLLVDLILLVICILVTEILAGVSLLLTSLSGNCSSGQKWHQYIRRICHLFRWAWRQTHSNLEPKRFAPSCSKKKKQESAKKPSSRIDKDSNQRHVDEPRQGKEIDSDVVTQPPMNPDYQDDSNA